MVLQHFARTWAERLTDSARECVEKADALFVDDPTEARQYLARAEAFDKDELQRKLASLEERFGRKTKGREAADRLRKRKRAVGDNVVEMPARDDI